MGTARRRLTALLLLAFASGAAPAGAHQDGDCYETPGTYVAIERLKCSIPLEAGRTEWRLKVYDGFEPEGSFHIVLADETLVARESCSGWYELLGDTARFSCRDGYYLPPYHVRTYGTFWRDGLEMGGVVNLPSGGGTLMVSGRGSALIIATIS